MDPEVIKEFLVGLGFGVDESSWKKFTDSIKGATLKVLALDSAVKLTAAGIFGFISKVSQGFEEMGYEYRLIAPAINKTLVLRNELLKAYSRAGINIAQVIQQSVKFNMALAKTKFALQAIWTSVAAKFFPVLTKQLDQYRKAINQNMPRIQAALEKFIKFIFKAFEATLILGQRIWAILQRVYDFFAMLHKATDGWSTIILGVVAAWKLLNLSFLATPIGMLIAGITALIALWDDFKVWQEGGKSLFNWEPFIPVIEAVTETLESLWQVLKGIIGVVFQLSVAIINLFSLNFGKFADNIKAAFSGLLDTFSGITNVIKGLAGVVGAGFGLGENIANGNVNLLNNVGAGGNPVGGRPLGTNSAANNPLTNQNVNQQTTINVTGSADATQTGKAVASQQTRVNYDMVRNLSGATR